MTDDERRRLVSTEQSLSMEPDHRLPTAISGLETFTLGGGNDPRDEEDEEDGRSRALPDVDSLFNLPEGGDDDEDDEDEDNGHRRR
jgi:hypothetical protein